MGEPFSGKSTLLNKLLGIPDSLGFKVSASSESPKERKGVYLWSVPINIEKEDRNLFFLDVQNFPRFELDIETSHKLFLFLTLISSTLLFNTYGNFNDSTFKKLYLLSTLTLGLNVSESDFDSLNREMPKIVWLLRDYEKDFKVFNVGERSLVSNPKIMMENLINSFEKSRNEFTLAIRKAFIEIFHDRDCFTFPKCSSYEENNKKFNYSLGGLVKRILNTKMKTLKNSFLNNRMMVNVIQYYCEMINQNIPIVDLNNAYTIFLQHFVY